MNLLYYGDNLKILRNREHFPDACVDLIYLDPPFNSNANYNVLFAEQDGTRAASQIQAFEDTWIWDESAAAAFEEVVEAGGRLAEAMRAFRTFLGQSNMMAYLAMMAPRLAELHRVLKPTGSLYLHCDPTASHYLKMLMDAVFGAQFFQNEIVWRRTGSHNSARRYGPIHDIILFYSKSDSFTWNGLKRPYMVGHVDKAFVQDGDVVRTNYSGNVLTGSGRRNGESGKPWRGFAPTAKNRHWAIPGIIADELPPAVADAGTLEKLEYLYQHGFITITPGEEWPRYQRVIGPEDGQPMSDIWAYQPYTDHTVFGTDLGIDDDVRWMGTKDQERLGYPTQKPIGLLERIIAQSTGPSDLVLDPFCGCGTTVAAAQTLGRPWIGIDITHLAIGLIRHRLASMYPGTIDGTYKVLGEPESLPDAADLAAHDPYQFQWWALIRVGAMPLEKKKGGDKGIDGRIYFHDEKNGRTKQVILSVKAGHINPGHLRDLRGVLDREKADIGVLLCLEEPTKGMRKEVASGDFYHSPSWNSRHPRLQILTVAEILSGKAIDMPAQGQTNATHRRAPRVRPKRSVNRRLNLKPEGEDD